MSSNQQEQTSQKQKLEKVLRRDQEHSQSLIERIRELESKQTRDKE